ncbi:peptide/nickel transport system permease protein [Rhodoligotrophos appendicifer]|uniref:ABC transporter permease n=1 Tax=Rhodoligotrophos appendicifer TaxID=987056 RepID=UPI001186CC77|nr:ABC transporter permease [Rhodoligotrophos appendicifer]
MARMIVIRVIHSLLVLLAVSFVIFMAVEVLPGDVARRMLGREAPEESLAILRAQMGLNEPILYRYVHWLGNALTFDFGMSFANRRPVWDIIAPRLANTAMLGAIALILYLPIVLVTAMIQATHRDYPIDHVLTVATIIVLSTPEFLLGTLMLLCFGLWLNWFPVVSTLYSGMSLAQLGSALILPAVSLAIIMSTHAVRMLRDNLIETLDSEFVTMAEFKGLSPLRILMRHVLPNALGPTLNITALNLSYVIGGVVLIERVFVFPGFGSLMIDSLQLRDVPLIEACVLIAASVYILGNLVADIVSIWLNPKLQT